MQPIDDTQIEELRRLYLFQVLTKEEMAKVAVILHVKKIPAGAPVFAEKDEGDAMYIVRSGAIRITRQKEGVVKEVALEQPGDFFGEIALFDYVLRTGTAVAAEESVVYEVYRKEFVEFISQEAAIGIKILFLIIQEMSKRLRRFSKIADDSIF